MKNCLKKLMLIPLGMLALFFVACGNDSISEIKGMVAIPNENFWIGICEVTQKEYKEIMNVYPSAYDDDGYNQHPVEKISWFAAMEYCKRLTERERKNGNLPKGYQYTLPTSAQWEIACRSGTTTRFCSGDSNEDLSRVAWWKGNSGNETHSVGIKEPNAWGIYDMHGNVWEWCLDEDSDDRFKHIIRGGAYTSSAVGCDLSNAANSIFPDHRYNNLGFRVALVPVQ